MRLTNYQKHTLKNLYNQGWLSIAISDDDVVFLFKCNPSEVKKDIYGGLWFCESGIKFDIIFCKSFTLPKELNISWQDKYPFDIEKALNIIERKR